jgi:hypothetical protein
VGRWRLTRLRVVQDAEEQFEALRMLVSKGSAMSKITESCLRYVDESIIDSLVQRLGGVVRDGIGLPTRAGTAQFIGACSFCDCALHSTHWHAVTLCMEHRTLLRGHTRKLLRSLTAALSDPSPFVSKVEACCVFSNALLTTFACSPWRTRRAPCVRARRKRRWRNTPTL